MTFFIIFWSQRPLNFKCVRDMQAAKTGLKTHLQAAQGVQGPFWKRSFCTQTCGPKHAQIGPTDTIQGRKGDKTRQKGSPHVACVVSVHKREHLITLACHRAPFLLTLGRFWPVLGPGQSRLQSSHLGLQRGNMGGKPELGQKRTPKIFWGVPIPFEGGTEVQRRLSFYLEFWC